MRNILWMSQDISFLYDTIQKKNEEIAESFVLADVQSLQNRYMKIQEQMRKLQADKKIKEVVSDNEYLDEAKILLSAKEKVSIIILNRNGLPKLQILMNSFHKKSFYDNFEIIFVDNASTDDSVAYMHSWSQEFPIKIIRNTENLSFSAANNQGVKESSGEYILFLNNDTEVTDGWLDELIIAMEKAENPGAIGAKLIYPHFPEGSENSRKSYCVQHAGIAIGKIVLNNKFLYQPYNYDNGKFDNKKETEIIRRAGVTAAVLMIKRSIFDEIGGYDEQYFYGYEDVDLNIKLFNAGYNNYYCPTCMLFHYEYGTQQNDRLKERMERESRNLEYFNIKWHNYLRSQILIEKLACKNFFTENKLSISVISENDKFTEQNIQGSIYFSRFLEQKGYNVSILNAAAHNSYYLDAETDILISFNEAYDISKINTVNHSLFKIVYVGKNYKNWCTRQYFEKFDLVFAYNDDACQYISNHSQHNPVLFELDHQTHTQIADIFIKTLTVFLSNNID